MGATEHVLSEEKLVYDPCFHVDKERNSPTHWERNGDSLFCVPFPNAHPLSLRLDALTLKSILILQFMLSVDIISLVARGLCYTAESSGFSP